MPGYHIIIAQFQSPPEQTVKFQMPVAVDTGIGCLSAFIACHKFADNMFFKVILKIKDIMGDPQAAGNAAGILRVIQSAAGAVFLVSVVEPHGGTHAAVACLPHHPGGNRAVHAAAHTDQSLFLFHASTSFLLHSSISVRQEKVNG